jgi:Uma2 family endonuclease
MSARTRRTPFEPMTIEEFLAFTDTRPQEEQWELIEGVAALNPRPTELHQLVKANVAVHLLHHRRSRTNVRWLPLFGVCIRVPASPHSAPTPDVFVKEGPATGSPVSSDALAIFEMLGPFNTEADQAWRRKVYASVPNCRHYVTVSLKAVKVVAYDRDAGWNPRTFTRIDELLDLPALGVSIPLADVYRWTPLANEAD